MIALLVALEVLRRGGVVVWIDFEDSPDSIAGRLLALGATEEEILSSFRYVQPAEPLTRATEIDLRLELHGSALVVIDAINEAMTAAELDPNANRDVAAWYAQVPRLAIAAGATNLNLDHVAKDPTAQRGAVGGGHKMASIDGAAYRIDAVTPFGRGSKGIVRLRLAKDRPGHVRGLLGPGKDPIAAVVAIDATDGQALVVEVGPPGGGEIDDWRPTRLMEKISIFVEGQTEPASTRAILAGVDGKQTYKATALEALVHGGYFARTSGPRNALLHTSERPFREEGP